MKGLRKYLSPFAPDQSGAAAVLCEFHGLIIILDAGGCAGNICGFDEPRWFDSRSAIFSAGLRDMDAILGRDDRLVEKIGKACEKLSADFIAVIGTPVPAVIATDYLALKRMTERKINIPVLTVDTDGMELYDKGEEKAFLELFKTFAVRKYPVDEKRVGILGMTPQDVSDLAAADKIRDLFRQKQDMQAVCYCMGDGLEEVKKASSVSKNIVVSPAAIATAQYLEKTFGTSYEIDYPLVEELLPEIDYANKKILVVHQQVIADSVCRELQNRGAESVQTAGWFMMKKELLKAGDIAIRDEDDYIELVRSGDFDIIFADECMKQMTPDFTGMFVNMRHFAVSGKLIGR